MNRGYQRELRASPSRCVCMHVCVFDSTEQPAPYSSHTVIHTHTLILLHIAHMLPSSCLRIGVSLCRDPSVCTGCPVVFFTPACHLHHICRLDTGQLTASLKTCMTYHRMHIVSLIHALVNARMGSQFTFDSDSTTTASDLHCTN